MRKINKTAMAAGLALAAGIGFSGQASAGIYAGSSLLIKDLNIAFLPFIPGITPNIGQFEVGGNIGATTKGTPAAKAPSIVPDPPWVTTARACGKTCACGTKVSTITLDGMGPKGCSAMFGPVVNKTRTGKSATASRAVLYIALSLSVVPDWVPNVT